MLGKIMKHKSGLIGFSYLTGLICASFINIAASFVLAAALIIAAVILSLRKKKAILPVILFTVSAAMAVSGIYTLICYVPLMDLNGKTRDIQGTITELKPYSGDKASYTVKTVIDGTEASVVFFGIDCGGKIGDKVSFTAVLTKITDNSNFAEESYYRSRGIFLKAQSVSGFSAVQGRSPNIKALLTSFGDYIENKIRLSLSGEEGALLKAMFLGDKSDLNASLSNNIKRCGISHFTAVSGLHLTVISHILMSILSLIPICRNRKIKFGLLTALILFFMLFFRLSMSVARAGIMLIMFYGSEVVMRKSSALSSMGIAVLIITLIQPYACMDIGFLLSVTGTLGVAVISPYFCEKLKKTAFYGIKTAAVSTLCATVTTFPLSCIFFGGFSTMGILVNLLIYPLFLAALICMVLFTLTCGFGTGFLLPAGLMAKAMIFIINFIGSFKYSYIAITNDTVSAICVLSVVFIAAVYFIFRSRRETVTAFILAFAVAAGSVTVLHISETGKARLILYSDGDHPCVIIENDGSRVICAGSDSPDIMEYIEKYMEYRFLDKVNSMIILNQDHNYLDKFRKIPCDMLILPDENTHSENHTGNIILTKDGNSLILNVKGINISVSAAGDPIDGDINIIYGYKKVFSELSGKTMFSHSRMYGENYYGINFYYEQAEFYITGKGYIERLKG